MLESTFQSHLIAALCAPGRPTRVDRLSVAEAPICRACGVRGFVRTGARVGAADLVGVIRPEGWHLEIEVKSATARITAPQKRRAVFVEDWGGVHVLARYDARADLAENVRRAVALVDEAIEARRARA